ncbi:hypothetical protein TSUD_59610 [Trifolium subterraneum]|uniref:Uncharacterized protein n=1 Tax=Trifolium subterraneum TaxID=3900 RepID=A0A2Z6MB82_TRISU|nr:hypothetical protein TSUD_59610 [Trifolium subterraneum]
MELRTTTCIVLQSPRFLNLNKPLPDLPSSLSITTNLLRSSSSPLSHKVGQADQQNSFPIAAGARDIRVVLNCIGEGLSCASTSGSACSCDDSNGNADTRFSDNRQMIGDCDKLIETFMSDESELTDWRKLLVNNNTKWSHIRLYFFRHCQDRADNEHDLLMKNRVLLLGNKLKEIDDDIQRHNQLIEMIKRTPSEISDIVYRNRKDFTKDFFDHLHTVAESYNDNPKAQTDLAKLRNTCLAAVKVYDTATERNKALNSAELNFQDIINSPMDVSDQKIDNFAEKGQCFDPDSVAYWLRLCYDVEEVGRVHTIVLKCFRGSSTYVDNNLICSYLRLGKLAKARKVFDGMTIRDTVSWTAIIDGYLKYNLDDEAFKLFHSSIKHGVQPNSKMFVCFMNLCSKRVDLALGKQIHACILKSNWRNLIVDSAVVNFYSKCGQITSAFRTFDRMEKRDVICWTTIITACSQHGLGHEALLMLSQMLGDGFFPNEYTICAALKACGENKALKYGTQLHGSIVKKICKSDVFIGTSLIDMYAKCGEIASSKKVFDRMRLRNTATWTSIISGYARNGFSEEALNYFRGMKRKKVCKKYSHALNVLKHMPFRDVVSWTAIISGCAKLGLETEALDFLREMIEEVLTACGGIDCGDLDWDLESSSHDLHST